MRRERARRRVSAVVAALVFTAQAVASDAWAGPTLLLDRASGQVLYAEQPDQMWYPASLTKIMTAYVVFDAVKAGRVKLDTPVPLSEKARGQPATRIGLKQGIPLNVEQAVRGLLLRSANDFAMALAELVGESEEGFAALMNATAKKLGMTRTQFKNPHGLPDPEQHTTARDLGILAMAVLRDFPDRAEMFSTMQFVIHKGTFHTQNDLMRTLDGADGMKTGFTCGAGYNIVATATRESRQLIAVVLGEEQRDLRSLRAAALIEHGFATAEWKQMLGVPRLAEMKPDPAELLQPVFDMSRQTRTRTCGNPVRRARQMVAQARRVKPAAAAQGSTAAPAAGSQVKAVQVVKPPQGNRPAPAAQGATPLKAVPSKAAAGGPGQ